MMKEFSEKKYAIVMPWARITEYMYDDVTQTTNTVYGIEYAQKGVSKIHAYSKQDGSVLFKKEVNEYHFLFFILNYSTIIFSKNQC